MLNNVEVTNMVMIYDSKTDRVLVQNRRRSWKGIAFPGGHLEPGESIRDSAVREVREETGLDVTDLEYCGMLNWYCLDDGRRTFIHYYKTENYSGELIPETEEGENFWVPLSELRSLKLAHGFEKQLDLFFNNCTEVFITYSDEDDDSTVEYNWM